MPDFSDLSYALGGYKRSNPYDARRKLAYAMAQQASDSSPIQSPWQGASRLAQGLIGGYGIYKADADEKAAETARNAKLAEAMAEQDPQKKIGLISAIDPEIGMRGGIQLAVEQAKLQQQQAALKTGAGNFGAGYGSPQGPMQASGPPSPLQPPPNGAVPPGGFANNSGNIRASGAQWEGQGTPQNGFATFNTPQAGANAQFKNFAAYAQANPTMTLSQALAKWAPPNENDTNGYIAKIAEASGINPGMPLGEVLKDPMVAARLLDAQTRIEKGGLPQGFGADTFIAAAGGPAQAPGGPQQAAPGVPGAVAQQPPQQIAQAPLPPPGQPPQIAQGGGDGTPPQPNPAGVNGPAVIAPPGVPDVPRPQPSPQQIQQYQQRIQSGEFGIGPEAVSKARAALDADLDRQWTVDRERRFKEFDLTANDYRAQRDSRMKQPGEATQNESHARQQFNDLQTVKDYRKSQAVFQSAVNAANTNSAAADLNLVYAFATMMDPGSVVREGEMGMVKATQNASDQVKAMVSAVTGGQRISPEARQALVDQMHVRYESLKGQHDELANAYGGIAERSGMKRDNVVVPIPEVKWTRSTKNQRGAPGETVYGLDGKPVQ